MRKNSVRVLAVVILLLAGAGFWRLTHPPLSPSQQIEFALDNATDALQNRSVGGVMSVLAKDFSYGGTSRQEIAADVSHSATRQDIADALRGAFFQWRDVQLQRTNSSVEVRGKVAWTRGNYILAYRPNLDAPLTTQRGTYHLEWVFTGDKQWKVSRIELKPEKGDFSIAD